MLHFIVSYNNAFRILHNLHICDVVLVLCLPMLSLTVVLRVLETSIFSLMSRLKLCRVHSLSSDMYTTSELYQIKNNG